jgi:hypothetical protein
VTYDIKTIAARYQCSPSTVSAWIANGELRAVCVSRSASSRKPRWRITDAALSEFEARRAAGPVAAPVTRRRKAADDDQIIQFYK